VAKTRQIKDMLIAAAGQPHHSAAADPATVSKDPAPSLFAMLVDELTREACLGAHAEELLARALRAANKPWGRSKIMFVGPGRAGKTGTERAMMGRPFEHTESTVGIDDGFTCEVTSELATVAEGGAAAGVSAWKEAKKAEKEYEAALAKVADMLRRGVAVEEVSAALQEELLALEEKRAQAAKAAWWAYRSGRRPKK